ncbi:glycosyltransferase family 2 protein [Pseudomonas coleopterorum]|uniref:glycosyltransferase family 2 protein n=1 Tax=Pseudomonas coleopterorum TaxID=1605838 RepID=UPI00142DD766|nr:glycosyltransferase [Pseudomonas coleopterorum]
MARFFMEARQRVIKQQRSYWGHLDGYADGRITGWALDRLNSVKAPRLIFLIDGKRVGSLKPRQFRSDLVASGIGDGHHGFSFKIPDTYLRAESFTVSVFFADDSQGLQAITGSPATYQHGPNIKIVGAFSVGWDGVVRGWATHLPASKEDLGLVVQVDGIAVGTVFTDIERPDVKLAGLADSRCGFQFVLSPSDCLRDIVDVLVLDQKTGASLTAGPAKFNAGSSYLKKQRASDLDSYLFQLDKSSPQLTSTICISILLPTYRSDLHYLSLAIESVLNQSYQNWQLCIADDGSNCVKLKSLLLQYSQSDPRISCVFMAENRHISEATNAALALAQGEYIGLLDHDDVLHKDAIFHVVGAIQSNPKAVLLYTNEDKCDGTGARYDPYFKPGYDPELMYSQNYISHFGVYKTDLVRMIGGFRRGYEGAQDYDLALRVTRNASQQQIVHINQVLYHWRALKTSTASSISTKAYAKIAMRKAIYSHIRAKGESGKIKFSHDGQYMQFKPSNSTREQKYILIISTKVINYGTLKLLQDLPSGLRDNIQIHIVQCSSPGQAIANIVLFNLFKVMLHHVSPNKSLAQILDEVLYHHKHGIVIYSSSSVTRHAAYPHWFKTLTSHANRKEIGFVTPRILNSNGDLLHYGDTRQCKSSLKETAPPDNAFGQLELAKTARSISYWMFSIRTETYKRVRSHCPEQSSDVPLSLDSMAEISTQLGFRNIAIPCNVIFEKDF